ncbi:precorrin-6Y C5,15-methyltransferase (decarboxylating) subunit CbiT [Thermoplasma sp.]|uniref:precorrin-6Y C5,15-methyltransferase (decarboxylating) subunit CbiT n=1 Tax=Thermoplasma sp. TaxID=1973142 RepID=UPI0026255BC2|nr:precorrin-6Y C5,15-methyltransferase (decarboxylating) subunit CbiT [Thermoplasma sp.]
MDLKQWDYDVYGIPDEVFFRSEGIPMTKREIRILSLSNLMLRRGMSVMDIGCGSGSMTVEISNIVGPDGSVMGIDIREDAVDLAAKNCAALCRYRNYTVEMADIYDFRGDRKFDAVFVGGGTAEIGRLFDKITEITHDGSRVVVNAIQLHTAYQSLDEMIRRGYSDVDVVQAMISKGMRTSEGYAMIARNPIFVISGASP